MVTHILPHKPRVLAVDDQRDSLRLLQIRLQNAGMDCFTAPNGVEALRFLQEQPVDLVILDVMMPQMDGFELCRRIKADPRLNDLPVLFLTARLETEDKVRGLEVGAHDYLSKPVEQQELLARTRAALRVKFLQDQLKSQLTLQREVNELHQGMLGQHWQKTLGQLAASLAHEINNPLAAALGTVQLLALEEDLPPGALDRLRIVDQSLQRAAQKLRSLLLIAQMNAQTQKFSLGQMIEDLLTTINFQMVMNKVSLSTRLGNDCISHGRPGELARALLYILNNAIEAVAGLEGASITIAVESAEPSHLIRVFDNGRGIDESIRSRVFEPFFTTKAKPHNGVGLYLSHVIIQRMGGTVTIHSATPPAVTEIRIVLPQNPPSRALERSNAINDAPESSLFA